MARRPMRRKLSALIANDAATALCETFLTARGKDLIVDGAAVQKVSIPAIQVILSAAQTWSRDGKSFRVVSPSDHLLKTLDQLAIPPNALGIE